MTLRVPDFSRDINYSPSYNFQRGDFRDSYQVDLGRIIHSASFRRLQTKTQVMGTGEGDFHRTRLTHSLEVGQIGRGVIWNIKGKYGDKFVDFLPPIELMEAICYAHDLGHPPFGHGGERALFNSMRNFGGFEGNAQTIRIISFLEKYYRGFGIKPTRRLLLGVLKYPVKYSKFDISKGDKPPKCYYDSDSSLIDRALSVFSESDQKIFGTIGANNKPKYKNFDCSIVELADDIAYGVHDLEDGVGRGILKRSQVEGDLLSGFADAGISQIREVPITQIMDKLFSGDGYERKHAISMMVGLFINSIEIKKQNVFESNFLDLQAIIDSSIMNLLTHLSKEITFKSLVNRREVQTLEFKGQKIVGDLFNAFATHPIQLVGAQAFEQVEVGLGEKISSSNFNLASLDDPLQLKAARAICDFVAGMTNPYAEKFHRRLFEPGYGSSTDEL